MSAQALLKGSNHIGVVLPPRQVSKFWTPRRKASGQHKPRCYATQAPWAIINQLAVTFPTSKSWILAKTASEEHTLYPSVYGPVHMCAVLTCSVRETVDVRTHVPERGRPVFFRRWRCRRWILAITIITVSARADEKSTMEMMTFSWTWCLCTGLRKYGSEGTH